MRMILPLALRVLAVIASGPACVFSMKLAYISFQNWEASVRMTEFRLDEFIWVLSTFASGFLVLFVGIWAMVATVSFFASIAAFMERLNNK